MRCFSTFISDFFEELFYPLFVYLPYCGDTFAFYVWYYRYSDIPEPFPGRAKKKHKMCIFDKNSLFLSNVSMTSRIHVRCFGSLPEPLETIIYELKSKKKFFNFFQIFQKIWFLQVFQLFPRKLHVSPKTMTATIYPWQSFPFVKIRLNFAQNTLQWVQSHKYLNYHNFNQNYSLYKHCKIH